MLMTDLASLETWKDLENFIARNYDMNGRAYDHAGKTFTGQIYWCNRLCPAFRQKPAAISAVCSAANQNLTAQARISGKPVVGECDLGLYKIVVPVFVSGELIGTVGGCGCLPEGGAVEEFIAEKIGGISPEELTGLCVSLKEMSQSRAEEMAAALAVRIVELIRS